MLGRKSGFQARVKAMSLFVISVYCLIHRSLSLLNFYLLIWRQAWIWFKMVNYIKTSALNSRLFKVICEDIGSEYLSCFFRRMWDGYPEGILLCVFLYRERSRFNSSEQKITNIRWFLKTKLHSLPYLSLRYFWSYESLQPLSSGAWE